jgi:hypothetical protein
MTLQPTEEYKQNLGTSVSAANPLRLASGMRLASVGIMMQIVG